MKQITALIKQFLTSLLFSRLALAIASFCLWVLLLSTPAQIVTAEPVTLTQALSPASQAQPTSAIDAQVKLIPKIRQFYGGERGYPGATAILFLTIGPLKIIPAFRKLTARADEALRRRLAFGGFLIATACILFAALFGHRQLVKFNIPLTAIVAAGGIVLFLVALRIVMSQYGDDDPAEPPPEKPSLDLLVQPLVFPTILTPYGIAVVITMAAITTEVGGNLMKLLGTLVGIMVLNLLAMLFARQILYVLKPQVLQVIGLVLGVIQLALGLGLILSAIELQSLVIKELLSL